MTFILDFSVGCSIPFVNALQAFFGDLVYGD